MSNALTVLLFLIASYVYFFLFWKALREDLHEKSLFQSSLFVYISILLLSVVGVLVSSFIPQSVIFNPGSVWFFGGVIAFFGSIALLVKGVNVAAGILTDALLPGVLMMLGVVSTRDLKSFVVVLATLGIYLVFKKFYKRIRWYKSGRPGFAAFAAICCLFILRIVFALNSSPVLFSIGRVDILLSAVIVFLSAFAIYNQSGL